MKVFNLPDLGEGLPEAEIVEWLIAEGEAVKLDQPLVSMETAKAVVEVPSPFTGTLQKCFGQAGDIIETGQPLAGFAVAGETVAAEAPAQASTEPAAVEKTRSEPIREDSGTVVGNVEISDTVVREQVGTRIKAVPAVRALARKLKVDIRSVTGSGKDGIITAQDVRSAQGGARTAVSPTAQPATKPAPTPATSSKSPAAKPTAAPAEGYQPVRGTRRSMARIMARAHAEIVPTSLFDDADISTWQAGQDITARLVRALVIACKAEPALNAWYDADNNARLLHSDVDVGLAVDSPEGLFVPALRKAQFLNADGIRSRVKRLRQQVLERSLPAEELTGYTIMLSNFGVFGGKYATPVITPPCVAILAAGRLFQQLVLEDSDSGGIQIGNHRMIPLSLTFDHRTATGGEAARFLGILIEDLAKPE